MNNNKTAGICYIKVSGQQFAYRGAGNVTKGTLEKEGVIGGDKTLHTVKLMPKLPSIEFETTDNHDLDVKTIETATDLTITVEFFNGKAYLLSNAYLKNQWQTALEDNKTSLVFEGSRLDPV